MLMKAVWMLMTKQWKGNGSEAFGYGDDDGEKMVGQNQTQPTS